MHRDWYDLCASGAVLTLPGPADLCRVSGDIATVKCLQDWSCGSHTVHNIGTIVCPANHAGSVINIACFMPEIGVNKSAGL